MIHWRGSGKAAVQQQLQPGACIGMWVRKDTQCNTNTTKLPHIPTISANPWTRPKTNVPVGPVPKNKYTLGTRPKKNWAGKIIFILGKSFLFWENHFHFGKIIFFLGRPI